jgi:hypothetical protein
MLYISNDENKADGFVRQLTFAKNEFINTFCEIRTASLTACELSVLVSSAGG